MLKVEVFADRDSLGNAATSEVAAETRRLATVKENINLIFAAGPSQTELLNEFSAAQDIPYTRTTAFHMDEYIELAREAEQRFGNFLTQRLFAKVPFKLLNNTPKWGLVNVLGKQHSTSPLAVPFCQS
jgi:glucosamine-6-phosphate deaminase